MKSQRFTTATPIFLQPPPGRRYVRSFLFSRRIDAPFVQIHPIARIIFIFCLSALQLRTMDAARPDPISAILLMGFSLYLLYLSGISARIARLYLLLTFPTLLGIFLTWIIFNSDPGHTVLFSSQVYSGTLALGLALWQLIWLAIVLLYYWRTRRILTGILLATLTTFIITQLHILPSSTELNFVHVPFYHQLTLLISDRSLLISLTKVFAYAGMIFATIALVMTGRDAELTGTLRQMRIPQPIIFFLSTVFRALDLALSDFETIYQAQRSRAIDARPRSFIARLRDLASIAVPMVAVMIRRSSEIGDALQARGYQISKATTDFYEARPWRSLDWLILFISLVFLYLAYAPHPGLTTLILHIV